MKLFTDIQTEVWERMFDVNVKGMFLCCKYVLPSMISRKKGKIINLSSIWGLVGASCEAHYSATKRLSFPLPKLWRKKRTFRYSSQCGCSGSDFYRHGPGCPKETLDAVAEETPAAF